MMLDASKRRVAFIVIFILKCLNKQQIIPFPCCFEKRAERNVFLNMCV